MAFNEFVSVNNNTLPNEKIFNWKNADNFSINSYKQFTKYFISKFYIPLALEFSDSLYNSDIHKREREQFHNKLWLDLFNNNCKSIP